MHLKRWSLRAALIIEAMLLWLTGGEVANGGPLCPPHGLFADCACNNSGHSSLSHGDSVTLFLLTPFLTVNASGCVIPVSTRTCAGVTGECHSGVYVTGGFRFKIYGFMTNPTWAYKQEITGTAE